MLYFGYRSLSYLTNYKSRFIYCQVFAVGTVCLTGDRVRGNDSKHYAISKQKTLRHEKIMIIRIIIMIQVLINIQNYIFKADNVLSINLSLPYGPPIIQTLNITICLFIYFC